jgi:hypothetical protein
LLNQEVALVRPAVKIVHREFKNLPRFRASPLMPEEQDKAICELPRTATWSSFLKVIRRRFLAAAAKKKNKDPLSVARAGE